MYGVKCLSTWIDFDSQVCADYVSFLGVIKLIGRFAGRAAEKSEHSVFL